MSWYVEEYNAKGIEILMRRDQYVCPTLNTDSIDRDWNQEVFIQYVHVVTKCKLTLPASLQAITL